MHPTVYFSKASGFSQHVGVKAGKNKLRFVVPETVDTTKSTFIYVRQEWFTTNRLGRITAIKAKPNKYLALDFTDRQYNSEVFTIYTKNWFGITREHDVIVDYSNFLRVFFPVPHQGETARRPIILPYSKLQTTYKHIYDELLKINSFYTFDETGQASKEPVIKDVVFTKENAKGRAFAVNNDVHLSLVYDFVLPGIFKNQTQKTQVIDYIDKTKTTFITYDPAKEGLEIQFNTPPFYISNFLGWYYLDLTGNRIDLKPGQEVKIPKWAKSELRLIARYDITTDTDKIGPELDKQGLVAVSYFDGAERVLFDIVKKGTPLKEHFYQKEGYAYAGWYRDSALTEKVNFGADLAETHTVLYLKSIKQNQPKPEKPIKYHTVNFITPNDANQLLPTKRADGQKLETNYLTPSLVSQIDANGDLLELDYWNLVDPVTGVRTKFDFETPITEDITLEAVMRKIVIPNSKYTIKRYFESVEQAGNFVEDKTKEEVVEDQTPGRLVELSPIQTNAPYGFTLDSSSVLRKKINKDGTTVFELKYKRNRYRVDFEVNFNGNHFKDVNASQTPTQTVPYEGKLTRPATPSITKAGYTYVFKHWQLKDKMGNVYNEGNAFDFSNTKITKNLTLVAYFEEKKDTATYTVKHIFQGIAGQINERVDEKKFTEQVGKSITVSQENRDKNYDQHFEVADFTETKKVEADDSTVFEIRYARKKYKVNFEVNYNGNHFAGATASVESEQEIPYQGKVKKPQFNPSLTKPGHTYTFKHWQLNDDMGNVYQEAAAFDFENTQITKNTTLVAYFEEHIDTVNYTIKHIFEGVGTIPENIEKEVKTAQVGTQITVDQNQGFNKPGFELKPQSETKTIEANGQTTFTLRYTRKTYTVDFDFNSGVLNGQTKHTDTYKFEQILKDIQHPEKLDPTHQKTYTFVGWENEETGEILDFTQNIKAVKNLKLKAKWQEATATRLVYLKLIWETLNSAPDEERELIASKPRAIGETARATDLDIKTTIERFLTNSPRPNHHANFDLGNSSPELTITATTAKQYLTLYFKAKTYTVDFDYSGLELNSVADELKSTITLKYTQKLSAEIIAKMQAVLKPATATKDFVFDKLIDKQTGEEFDQAIAYNRNLELKPVFKEKEVTVSITPKVADFDQDKVENPTWPAQTAKVGTKFNFQPTTNIKTGWRFLGWAKTPGGQVEEITVERTTSEVYAVFAPGETTYKINHVFEGIQGEIQEHTEVVTKPAQTNAEVTVSKADRLSEYDHGFEVKTASQTQNVKPDGSTTFTLKYSRREFDVNFVVNYQNKFSGTVSANPLTQKVKYEGKAQQPNDNPTIEKHGRTYQFIHWQTEVSMNGSYSQQSAYDFSQKVTGSLTLIAYFKETIHTVNYKVIHYLEKTGKEESLNGQYDQVVEERKHQKVEDGANYGYYNLDSNLYEVDQSKQSQLNSLLQPGNNTTEVYQYYKLKDTIVEFKKTDGISSLSYYKKTVKRTRNIKLPTCVLKDTYKLLGWSLTDKDNIQNEFTAAGNSMEVYALTDYQDRQITYTVKTQKVDGSYEEKTEIRSGKIGSTYHIVYTNPNETMYQEPIYNTPILIVSSDQNQNHATITINRKVYTIQYKVKGHLITIPNKEFLHGQEHGEINESNLDVYGYEISKIELDNHEKTKIEIKKLIVTNNHTITIFAFQPTKKVGKYPQTEVINPDGIKEEGQDVRKLNFHFKTKYTMEFTRNYYKDNLGNRYEKFNGKYFKFEDVEFVKIPMKNTWYAKRIIDVSQFNVKHYNYIDNNPEHSIYKAMVEEIGKIIGETTYMPSYDDGDFGVKLALQTNMYEKRFSKFFTHYAFEVAKVHTSAIGTKYRGFDLSKLLYVDNFGYFDENYNNCWWLGSHNQINSVFYISKSGKISTERTQFMFGIVPAIR